MQFNAFSILSNSYRCIARYARSNPNYSSRAVPNQRHLNAYLHMKFVIKRCFCLLSPEIVLLPNISLWAIWRICCRRRVTTHRRRSRQQIRLRRDLVRRGCRTGAILAQIAGCLVISSWIRHAWFIVERARRVSRCASSSLAVAKH